MTREVTAGGDANNVDRSSADGIDTSDDRDLPEYSPVSEEFNELLLEGQASEPATVAMDLSLENAADDAQSVALPEPNNQDNHPRRSSEPTVIAAESLSTLNHSALTSKDEQMAPIHPLETITYTTSPELKPGAVPDPIEVKHFGTMLRKIIDNTEKVLLERTKWRHEYSQLQHRMGFLVESLEDMMIAYDAGPGMQRIHSPENCPAIDILPERTAQHPYVDATPSESARASQEIRKLYDQVKEDLQMMRRKEEETTHLGDELSNLEYNLTRDQEAVLAKMKSEAFVLELRQDMSEAIERELAQPAPLSETSSEESDMPSLVKEFFSRKGDIGVYLERLNELDFNHEEGKMEREFLKDRGDELETSDDQFERNYKYRRKEIVEDLQAAEDDTEMLKKRLEDDGIDPNVHRTSGPSMQPTSTRLSLNTFSDGVSGVAPIRVAQIREDPTGIPLPPMTRGERVDRIEDWRYNVSTPTVEELPDTEQHDSALSEASRSSKTGTRHSSASEKAESTTSSVASSTHIVEKQQLTTLEGVHSLATDDTPPPMVPESSANSVEGNKQMLFTDRNPDEAPNE